MPIDFPIISKQAFYCGNRSGSRNRVCIVSTSQKHSPRRVGMNEPLHQLLLASECRDWIAVGHGLAKHNQVWSNAGNLRIATQSVAKACLDLIKNEDEATTISQVTQALKIPGRRFDDPDILQNRLRNKGCYRILLANVIHRLKIIEVNWVNQFLMFGRNPGAYRNVGVFSGGDPFPYYVEGSHQITGDIVMPSVVATLNDDDVILSGNRAGQANGLTCGFASSIQELDRAYCGYVPADKFGQLPFQFGGS